MGHQHDMERSLMIILSESEHQIFNKFILAKIDDIERRLGYRTDGVTATTMMENNIMVLRGAMVKEFSDDDAWRIRQAVIMVGDKITDMISDASPLERVDLMAERLVIRNMVMRFMEVSPQHCWNMGHTLFNDVEQRDWCLMSRDEWSDVHRETRIYNRDFE